MRVAPDKRSAVRGNEEIIFPSFHGPPRQPAGWRGGPWKEGLLLLLAGFPGRQSLRSFALGYLHLAPTGRQMGLRMSADHMRFIRMMSPNQTVERMRRSDRLRPTVLGCRPVILLATFSGFRRHIAHLLR